MGRSGVKGAGALTALLLPLTVTGGASDSLYESAPIHYHEVEPDTKLTRYFQTASQNATLCHGTPREILDELLDGLGIPVASQVLVFSKTSAQNSLITPATPRAIYFSDDLYLGWVQGGEIEVASFDARLGLVFHLIKLSDRTAGQPPRLVRDRSCLNCHGGSSNHDLPGLMVRSVYPGETGLPRFEAGTFHTRQDSPISERWGGWYVTGHVEGLDHLGNRLAKAATEGTGIRLERIAEANLLDLETLFPCEPYPGGGRSDVVALMMLEHQVGVHNLLVEANLTTRATLHRHAAMQKAFGEPVDAPLSETNHRILDGLATRVLHEMLYVDEVQVPGGIEGGEAFQAAFDNGRHQSRDGRSLRDFRLLERLMKYRCSHLIYSEAFATLPEAIRNRILDQLHGILTRPADWPGFAHLGHSERTHLLTIVRETVPDLPASWDFR